MDEQILNQPFHYAVAGHTLRFDNIESYDLFMKGFDECKNICVKDYVIANYTLEDLE